MLVKRFIEVLDYTTKALGMEPNEYKDLERRNHLLFIQQIETFIALLLTIRYGDIGIINLVINRYCLLFHRGKQRNYALEMLQVKHLFSTEYATPKLRRATIATCLVNTSGRKDRFIPADLAVEILNKDVKEIWRYRHGSKTNIAGLTEYCSLNGIFFRPISEHLHRLFAKSGNRLHPLKAR